MGIETKTLGILIDELFTTDMKLWFSQEKIMDSNSSIEEIAEAAKKSQELNKRRNSIIKAIDQSVNQIGSPTEKTY
jgi:hypothetical protein